MMRMMVAARELPFCDVSNILTYRPELLTCDSEMLSMRIRDIRKETLESYGMPSSNALEELSSILR